MDCREKYEDIEAQIENLRANFLNNSPVIDLELLPLKTGVENSGLIFYLNPVEKILKSFDCDTRQIQSYNVPELPIYSGYLGVMFSLLDKEKVLLSGGQDLEKNKLKS